jgi:uncharacterized protein with PIN domain
MDGTSTGLKEKLDQLIHQAAEASVALDRAEGRIVGVPHYSVIELRAHELGRQLSREVQTLQMSSLAGAHDSTAKCPKCGARHETSVKKRSVTSMDGPLAMEEPVGHCPACRRDFFPPPGSARL